MPDVLFSIQESYSSSFDFGWNRVVIAYQLFRHYNGSIRASRIQVIGRFKCTLTAAREAE